MIDIDFLALAIAVVASMVLTALWYSPLIFGNAWLKTTRLKKMPKAHWQYYAGSLVTQAVMAFLLAVFLYHTEADSILSALQTAFFLWLGFIATATFSPVIWEKKPFRWWLIANGNLLLSVLVMATIISAW